MSRVIIGAIIGYIVGGLFFGPAFQFIGAIIGAFIGRSSGRRAQIMGSSENMIRIHQAFTKATFQVMGAVAKADGSVTEQDIQHAENVFTRFNMSEAQRQRAISYFNSGKQDDFSLEDCMLEFLQNCPSRNLHRTFIQIQFQTAYVDGELHAAELDIIMRTASLLRISDFELRSIEALVAAQFRRQQYGSGGGSQQRAKPAGEDLAAAYQIIGATPQTSNHELKKMYRKLMSQHHPDKLASQGLPEEMIKVATEKTKEITWAYDLIKDSRAQT